MQLAILIIICVLFVALIVSSVVIVKAMHKLRSGVIAATADLVSTIIKGIGKMTDDYVDAFNKSGEQHAEFTRRAVENCNKNYKNTVELVTQSLKVLTDSNIDCGNAIKELQEIVKGLQDAVRPKTTKKKEIKVE